MANPSRKIEHAAVFEQTGKVITSTGAELTVETDSGTYAAKRAVSCLVEPEPGDLVLVAVTPRGAVYALAVLERPGGAPTTLTADGDMAIRLRDGRFTVAAQEGVDLVSGKDMALIAGELRVTASLGSVALSRLAYVGSIVETEIERLKMLGGTVDSTLTRLYQRVKRSYRVVEELDQVKAERIDYEAKEHVRLHGKNALITAECLVKVDGDQIHLG
jgi:hypothetical protein